MIYSDAHKRFLTYIKAVGTGPKGNRELSEEEMFDCFSLILNRQIPDTLISAFLLGWRVQGETVAELSGVIQAIKATQKDYHDTNNSIEIGYPLDGKQKLPPLMMEASKLLNDIKIHVTGDNPQSPKFAYNPKAFTKKLTYNDNLVYHDRSDFNPLYSALTPLRNDLGIRSAINTIEKLNFLAPNALIGMHHMPYFELYQNLYAPHYKRLLIVQGHEGTPEVVKKAKMKLIGNGVVEDIVCDPKEFGIEPLIQKENLSLEQLSAMVEHPTEQLTSLIKLNAAVLLFAGGYHDSIEEAYKTVNK
jgi:anthranilate phosphoribosyltransferase